jgi:phage terminase large subunit-like protein
MVARGKLGPLLREAKREGWSDWIRNEHDERAVLNGCVFDIDRAEHVRTFFDAYLRHSKAPWAGKPFTLAEWEWKDLIAPAYGWLRPDGYRRIRKVYCEIAKKNGKSTLGAGVGLYALIADGEAGAEVYCVATKRDQAILIHDEAKRMVKASPDLYRRLRINHATHVITFESQNAKFAAMSSDGPGSEGPSGHMLLIDEMHAWKDRVLWDSLRYLGAARMQPMVWIFTTAGVYDITSIGWQEHDYARRWLLGPSEVEDQEFLGYICAADKADDILDPKAHRKANPSYGITIRPDEIMKAATDAKAKATELFTFLRYRLNQWTEALSAWIPPDKWDACGDPVDETKLVGRKCYGGLDIASKVDLCAWVLVFPPAAPDTKWAILPRFWVPRESATVRSKEKGVNYLVWAREGLLTLTPGNKTDLVAVCKQIEQDRKKFAIERAGADPWNIGKLQDDIDPSGEWLGEFPQNFASFSQPTKDMEATVLSGDVRHGGHSVLKWCVGNVVLLDDTNGNVRPSKKHSIEKVDGAVATLMAWGEALLEKDTTRATMRD